MLLGIFRIENIIRMNIYSIGLSEENNYFIHI